jgi:alpha-beta hydrolase superfamily lysophospholipase
MQLCMERSRHQRLHFSYLQDISAPVRVFAGTADSVMPFQHVSDWAQHAAHGNIELVTVQGGTHDGLMHTHKVKALEALAADVARSSFKR